MTNPIQRLHYFDQQFLRAVDFTAEQEYQLGMRRQHNRAVHGWGIGAGLIVEVSGATAAVVRAGYAIDAAGREIVLNGDETVELAGHPAGATVYVTIAYGERTTDPSDETGVRDDTRWTEEPDLETGTSAPADPSQTLVLGQVTRAGTQVTGVDASQRRSANVPALTASLQADVDARILRTGDDMSGNLSIAGRLGVGTTAPGQKLTVAGGELGVLSAMIQTGRIDSSPANPNEVVGAIGFFGPGVQHGQLSFRAGSGFELVDRSSDGPTLSYSLNAYPYAALRARSVETIGGGLSIGGDVAIQSKHALRGNDSWLRLNSDGAFSSGTHTPGLFAPMSLNVGGVGGWGNPGANNAWITGSLGIGSTSLPHRLTVAGGDIQLDGGHTLLSTGRLHVRSEERLYLLAANGVYITQDWGGPGELNVSNSVYINGYGPTDRTTGGEGLICWDVEAKGGLYSSHKAFLIDHPLDPDERQLAHACLEGPENGVYYRGVARLTAGEARVELPGYFEALTREDGRTVMLTPKLEDGDETVALLAASAVRDGAFMVRAASDEHAAREFYWELKAVRADVEPLVVERAKVAAPALT